MPIHQIIVHHVPADLPSIGAGDISVLSCGSIPAERSFVVTLEGECQELRFPEEPNATSGFINIFCVGDCDIRPPSEIQVQTLITLLRQLMMEYALSSDDIVTHRDAVEFFEDAAVSLCPGLFLLEKLKVLRRLLEVSTEEPKEYQALITLSLVEDRGDEIVVEGKAVNVGTISWSASEPAGLCRFGARVVDRDLAILLESRVEMPKEGVQPGESAPFTFVFLAAELPAGSHSIVIDVVVEGKFWFSRFKSPDVFVELGKPLSAAEKGFLIEERAALGSIDFLVWAFSSSSELLVALGNELFEKCLTELRARGLTTVVVVINCDRRYDLILPRRLVSLGLIYESEGLPALEPYGKRLKACVCFTPAVTNSIVKTVLEVPPHSRVIVGTIGCSPVAPSENTCNAGPDTDSPSPRVPHGVWSLEPQGPQFSGVVAGEHYTMTGAQRLLRSIIVPKRVVVVLLASGNRHESEAWARKMCANNFGFPCQCVLVPTKGYLQELPEGKEAFVPLRGLGGPNNQTDAVNRIVAANSGADIILIKEGVQLTEATALQCLQDEAYSVWATGAVGGVVWSEGFISEGGGEIYPSGYVKYFQGPFPDDGVVSVGFVSTWLAYFRGDAFAAVGAFLQLGNSLHFSIIEWCWRARERGLDCRSIQHCSGSLEGKGFEAEIYPRRPLTKLRTALRERLRHGRKEASYG